MFKVICTLSNPVTTTTGVLGIGGIPGEIQNTELCLEGQCLTDLRQTRLHLMFVLFVNDNLPSLCISGVH